MAPAFLINLLYVAASVLFIFGIKMLGSQAGARRGNFISAVGMLVAVIATGLYGGLEWWLVFSGILLGSAVGLVAAYRVPMTAMPEMVGLFNGFGGLASLFIGWAEYAKVRHLGMDAYLHALPVEVPAWFTAGVIFLTVLIGGVTFTGSMVAFLKLAEKIPGRPLLFPGQQAVNAVMFAAILALGGWFTLAPESGPAWSVFLLLVVLSLAAGVMTTAPIGGGDMPVAISLLNSYSGLAGAAAGFVILNNVLIVAGCLVGASGIILTVIMCKAMNRTLGNVLFGGFGSASAKAGAGVQGEMRALSTEDAYHVLEAAGSVLIVPGYGMAVAQAQHAVKELARALENNGTEVRFAIHPVAGRMPGHMNVLLAEADVPYEQLCEMDEVNPTISSVDVALVIGANDVVNPSAIEDPACPIYGMPIINVHEARNVFALKRGKGAGFSGLENALFFRPNCRMIYGDAKATVSALAAQFEK